MKTPTFIDRKISPKLLEMFSKYPVVTVTGPRQSGKTTLVRHCFPNLPYVNMEYPDVRELASTDPRGFLSKYKDGAIFDEIQRVPQLTSYLQPLIDERKKPGQFVLTGSQHFELMKGLTQSLAGRTAIIRLLPFSIEELETPTFSSSDNEIVKGYMPRVRTMDIPPPQAHADYFMAYVERDLRQIENIKNLTVFERFVRLCAGRTGQLLNLSNLASDAGISHTTAGEWISVLEASFIIFRLQPWHGNISKRLVKTPKIFFHDVGLASWLIGVETPEQLAYHPLRGSLFENLIVSEIIKHLWNRCSYQPCFFYRDSEGTELDFLVPCGKNYAGVEVKSGLTFSQDYLKGFNAVSKIKQLGFDKKALVYGGSEAWTQNGVDIIPWQKIHEWLPLASHG